MEVKSLQRSWWQRLLGIPATGSPVETGCWSYKNSQVTIDLKRVPELSGPGGAIRLEGKNLPFRILVVHSEDGAYCAFRNHCKHMGRRLDPVPGTETVQCCSVGKSTYAYDGRLLNGPAKGPAETFPVQQSNGELIITL
jgi:nitrite reductase/ring-hydroxylating ferredoxin subunit